MLAMRGRWELSASASLFAAFRLLVAVVLLLGPIADSAENASPTAASPWLTLTGDTPVVVAKGGFSGIFPDSSSSSYKFSYLAGSPDTISWCDVRLTKDGSGICLPNLLLDNCTNVRLVYPNGSTKHIVNGKTTAGWFSVDYDMKDLSQVSLAQEMLFRTNKFDASLFPILNVEDLVAEVGPVPLWLNIQNDLFYRQHRTVSSAHSLLFLLQNDLFYRQHNLSMRKYLLSLSKHVSPNYVSSPEVDFLRSIVARFRKSKTKLIFCFLEEDFTEPSTNITYGSLLKNLTFVKTFASGILVPKHYIWPVTLDGYLQPYTTIVKDAHKEGLEVFVSGFANDELINFNHSYNPLAEVLSFIDNGIFSVDGVLTDFPITASEAIGCYSHINTNKSDHGKPLIITHNGASGVYPDSTDLSYEQAIKDGANYIDCPVQVTKDGVLICMSSINLMEVSTVAMSPFSSRTSVITEIYDGPGIFTFNLTWEEIYKNIKPAISNPYLKYGLYRNPLYKNAGNFMRLSDFLAFGKGKDLSGILISIENAAFLAENLGYSVTDGIMRALQDAGYSNQTSQDVVIQSKNSSVLIKFRQESKYKLVYMVDETISDADDSSLKDIKQFAHAVAISKQSVYPVSNMFITGQTKLVEKLQSAGFEVYVYVFRNEFISQPWDFLSDPTVEINMYVQGAGVDGIITDFPGTAALYKRNSCLKLGDQAPGYMNPVPVGGLLQVMEPQVLPPALAPMPSLIASDVVEPPLPPASLSGVGAGEAAGPAASPPSYGHRIIASTFVSLSVLCGSLLV